LLGSKRTGVTALVAVLVGIAGLSSLLYRVVALATAAPPMPGRRGSRETRLLWGPVMTPAAGSIRILVAADARPATTLPGEGSGG
jgi:hypothetical protein